MSATFWNMRRRQAARKLENLKKQEAPEQLEIVPETDGEFTEMVDMPEAPVETEEPVEAPVEEKPKKRATRSKVKADE